MLVARTDARRRLVRRGRRPLVGYVSYHNTLSVTEMHDRTRVGVKTSARAVVLAVAALFGPALAAFFAVAPERFTRMPLFIQAVVVITIAAMTIVLVRTLVRRPRFDLVANGDITVTDPDLTIPRDRVRGVVLETEMYANPPRIYVANSVLVVQTVDGEVRLCASPDAELVGSVARRAATLTRTELKSNEVVTGETK